MCDYMAGATPECNTNRRYLQLTPPLPRKGQNFQLTRTGGRTDQADNLPVNTRYNTGDLNCDPICENHPFGHILRSVLLSSITE